MITAICVDNGEKLLERCIQSLRNQSVPIQIVIASGPKTSLELASKLVDKVHPPVAGIGRARVQAILAASTPYILSCDSVPGYTPLLIRNSDMKEVDIVTINDLATFTESGKELVEIKGVEVSTGYGHFTQIKHILRHPFEGKLKRINTGTGMIDVSLNHVIYGRNSNLLTGESVGEGTELSQASYISNLKGVSNGEKLSYFIGTKEQAWLYGLLMGDGSVSESVVSICNTNSNLLDKTKDIMVNHLNCKISFFEDKNMLKASLQNKGLAKQLREKLYTKSGYKKVPREVLNAPREIKYKFLEGYIAADGSITNNSLSLSEGSPVAAAGLLYLYQTLHQDYSVDTREDKNEIRIRPLQKTRRTEPNIVKKAFCFDYKGYLYDIETASHRFRAGVGNFNLHNSDTVYDSKYAEVACQDLKTLSAVRAGSIRPLEGSPMAWVETATQLAFAYEFSLAFRRQAFLDSGIHRIDYSQPKNDIGIGVLTRLLPFPDPRMVCWTRMPTYHAELAAQYAPIALGGLAPLAASAGVALANEIAKIVGKRG